MPYVIGEPCIDVKDRACVAVCPVDCIIEVGRMQVIDPDVCIDCGACEPECPVDAIFADDDLPDELREFTEINASVVQGVEEVDALVDRHMQMKDLQDLGSTHPG